MKGTEGYIISQFIIDNTDKVSFMWQPDTDNIAQDEIQKLKRHISEMSEKYVPIDMGIDDSDSVFVTYFKDKIHIGYNGELSEIRLDKMKRLFSGSLNTGNSSSVCGQITANLEIREDFVNLGKVVAKTAINTLAYITDAEYIVASSDFDQLIEMILSDDDKVLTRVSGIKDALAMKQHLHLSEEQHFCLITHNGKGLKALVFFYDRGFEVTLCKNLSKPFFSPIEGLVCDWKNRKDYRYLDYLTKIGVLT